MAALVMAGLGTWAHGVGAKVLVVELMEAVGVCNTGAVEGAEAPAQPANTNVSAVAPARDQVAYRRGCLTWTNSNEQTNAVIGVRHNGGLPDRRHTGTAGGWLAADAGVQRVGARGRWGSGNHRGGRIGRSVKDGGPAAGLPPCRPGLSPGFAAGPAPARRRKRPSTRSGSPRTWKSSSAGARSSHGSGPNHRTAMNLNSPLNGSAGTSPRSGPLVVDAF